jgi:hypothetical protein
LVWVFGVIGSGSTLNQEITLLHLDHFFQDILMYKGQLNAQRLSCLVELATGTALLLTPGLAMVMIVGSSLPNGGNQMAQLFGAAITCLGLSCWSNSQSACQDEMPSIGLMTYNIISGFLLSLFAFSGDARASVVLPAALLHIALGVALLRRKLKGRR